ncbi:MAG: hypothetical protein VXX96_02395 [Bacteroidota bacterium]|nr:hypothetical protein [Bacteroidota bacterium]MEC8602032.1 hypothetical protein [Bacteroidota bacterium]
MPEKKYFRTNYTFLGSVIGLVLFFVIESLVNNDPKFINFIIDNYLLFIPLVIFSLLFGITYNTINQTGLKRTTFFGGYTIRSIDWNKIKYFAQVDEEWRQTSGVTNNDSIWFIGHDDILHFRIVAKNEAHLKEIIDEANKFSKKYDKILKYTDPSSTIHRIFKINYNKIKT